MMAQRIVQRIMRGNPARSLALLASLGATLLLAACGGGGDSGKGNPPPTQPPTITRVDVSSTSTTLLTQQTAQLSAIARLSDGSSNSSPNATWSTSSAAVATVSASGLVTGVGAGSATITATVGSVTGTIAITVTSSAGVLATVAVTLTDPALQLAQNTQAAVAGKDGLGANVALGSRPITWSSSNVAIATVTAAGLVNAVGVGTANIQVSVVDGTNTRTASAVLTVSGVPGAPTTTDVSMPGLTFSPFQALVKQNGTVRFIFPTLDHNVFWDPRLTGQPSAPADINTTNSTTVSRTFPNVGVFTYKCTLHPGMDGTIIVSP